MASLSIDNKCLSMKRDENYDCFACGTEGVVIDYVSRMFGLSQYETAFNLIKDLCLPVQCKVNKKPGRLAKKKFREARIEQERIKLYLKTFQKVA